jgi:hypothetical protein
MIGRPLIRPVPQISKPVPIPAPTAGINAIDGLAEMGPRDAIYSYNFHPGQYGLKVRTGYQEWATNIGVANGGRTIMPYLGSSAAENVLFATSKEGIFDISASGNSFVAMTTFAIQDDTSGYGQYSQYTTNAGQFMLYCDESNGYYYYDEGTGTWSKPTLGGGAGQVSGVDPANLVAVCNHKERLWFVERDSGSAWYLAPGSITGAATEFNFGSRFKKGGYLVNLYNWTVDGGEGLDDYLVAVSSAGDVLVFKGTDPSSATTWGLHGSWFIGQLPIGRRVGGSIGGELYLLSSYGVLPISRLLSGAVVQEQATAISERITPLIKSQMDNLRTEYGWEIQLIPRENILLVSVPQITGIDPIQFVQSTEKKGWGMYRHIPYFTGAEWQGNFYFSDGAGTAYTLSGTVDNLSLDGSTSNDIEFSLLTAFADLQPVAGFKRVHFTRAIFLAAGAPGYDVRVIYDYEIQEADPSTAVPTIGGSVWDAATWDNDVWGGGAVTAQTPIGGSGMGRAVAVALRGQTNVETTLVRLELICDGGGLL